MSFLSRSLTALLLAAHPATAAAQEGTPAAAPATFRLTVAEALARAKENSARLLQLEAQRAAADAGLRGAKAARWPVLDVSAGYTRYSNVPELSVITPGPPPERLTVFPNIPDQYRTRAGIAIPLYTGGRISGNLDAATAQSAAASHDAEAGEKDLVLETRTAYWSLVAARETERVLSEAVAAFEAHLKDAGNRERFGMAARNEVLSVQVERDRAELNRLQAANQAEVAHADLVRLVGVPDDSRIEPIEPLSPPAQPAEAPGALVLRAIESRPEAQALRARITALDAGVKVAHAASLPQAGITGGYDYSRPNSRILPLVEEWKSSWSVGVSLSFTVFDGGRTSSAAAQAQAQANAARRQLEDLTRRIRLEVTARVLDLGTARAALLVAERNLEAAKENLRVSRDRYREGLIVSSELLDAETALLRAGLDETQAVTQVQIAFASLERAAAR